MAAIDLKEVSDNFKQSSRNKNNSSKNDSMQHKSEENGGMMSLARWFRELRGKSSKEAEAKAGKTKDERRVKLNRTNSALPSNFKHSDFVDLEDGGGGGGRNAKYEKKIKDSDKRRYSFNGGSSSKLSRNPRSCLLDERRLQKSQNSTACDKSQPHRNSLAAVTETSTNSHHNESPHAMIGSELPKKTRSSLVDHKHAIPHHSSSSKLLCGGYQKFDDTGLHPAKLKTVVEKCEKLNTLDMLEPTKALDEEARSREKIYMPHVECERMFVDDDDNAPCPPDRDISLANKSPHHMSAGTFHQYNHSHQDSSYMSQDGDYAECYVDEGRTILTKAELEQYTKDYEEHTIKTSHQKQPSYAQSEGYHSYVSSNDSAIITPLLDRLRRENDIIVSMEENMVADRKSSASSGSSSDTLKWHGSLSDVSVASGSYRSVGGGSSSSNNSISNSQHNIVHSARVQTPQRHHSESVLYLGAAGDPQTPSSQQQQQWQDKVQKNNQLNSQMRKLFPVNTYSVYPQQPVCSNGLPDLSPVSPKLTVAERIIELERQQLNQTHQQVSTRYTYLDPDKKHKVSDQNLKVIQKKALLSYYERHHSSWRSEPQLSPVPSPPQPPRTRPRLPTPTSRRSSSASDYQDSVNKENRSCQIEQESYNSNDVTNGTSSNLTYQNETKVFSQYSSSCGSLASAEVGPMIIGDPICVDDWVPELPPKKAHLRAAFTPRRLPSPDLPPPSPPPIVDDEVFISDEPLPPPPPEILSDSGVKSKEVVSRPPVAGVVNSRSTAPDIILSSTSAVLADEGESKDSIRNRAELRRSMRNITNEQKKMNINRQRMGAKIAYSSKSKESEFLRYSRHLYKDELATAEYRSQAEPEVIASQHHRVKEPFQRVAPAVPDEGSVKPTQNTDFLAKRSVFSNGYPERQSLRYSSTQKLQVNGKLSAVNGNQNAASADMGSRVKYRSSSVRPSSTTEFKKVDSMKDAHFSSVVLRHSEKFPAKLDPQCPPTTYQLSQSSYRREPRDREKGLPNFEGSYKRTMSPSSSPSCTSFKNGYVNGTNHCAKDVENVDPKTRSSSENSVLFSGKYETTRAHHVNCVPAAAAVLTSQQACRDSERHVPVPEECQPHVSATLPMSPTARDYACNSLPKNCVLNVAECVPSGAAAVAATTVVVSSSVVEPKQRSSRTPRTQSDPSSVKESSAAASALLCSQSSSSSLSLQKAGSSDSSLSAVSIPRSQSDLSNVGSTESGYSSLSLNIPSPSVSPTRLSSSSTSSTVERSSSMATSWSCSGMQCDLLNVTTGSGSSQGSVTVASEQRQPEAVEDADSTKYPQKSEIVLRIGATTNDAASQTDTFGAAVVARAEPATGVVDETEESVVASASRDRSTSPIFVQKSQEEIDCDELSRELVSHLSSNDRFYRLLAPKPRAKKSTDYLENVFQPNLLVSYSEYSCSSLVKQSEDTRLQEGSITSEKISYQSETTTYRTKQNQVCDTPHDVQTTTHYQLQQKKEKLLSRLEHRLNLLKAEQTAMVEDCRMNDALGEMISQKVAKCVSAQEAAKYKLHIQEIGHITSLLLGLSGRLAKVENSLLELTDDCQNEKKNLESKQDKLLCQLEEAKALKTNIDKRSSAVSALLVKYFTDEEVAEYEYFVHMKSKLLIDCREVSEKIEGGERQLAALKEAVDSETNS